MAAAASVDPWDQGGTYTREQLEGFRGPLDGNGNGRPLPHEVKVPAEPVGACLQCQTPLRRADQKYCSGACRSRYRRAHLETAVSTKPASAHQPEPVALVGTATDNAIVGNCGPFEQLVAVATGLPAGWRLEATPDTLTLVWTR
jgi:hypothetical protein